MVRRENRKLFYLGVSIVLTTMLAILVYFNNQNQLVYSPVVPIPGDNLNKIGSPDSGSMRKPSTYCTDSDGGLNYYLKGIARDGGMAYYEDTCLYKNQTGNMTWRYMRVQQCSGNDINCNLQEGYCKNNSISNLAHQCLGNELCLQGECTN